MFELPHQKLCEFILIESCPPVKHSDKTAQAIFEQLKGGLLAKDVLEKAPWYKQALNVNKQFPAANSTSAIKQLLHEDHQNIKTPVPSELKTSRISMLQTSKYNVK